MTMGSCRIIKKRYFTLIELMIVLSIILSMGAVLSINIAKAVREQRFNSAAKEVLNKIQVAQDLMLMQRSSVFLTLTQHQKPTPYVECVLEMGAPCERKGIKTIQKLIEHTNTIAGIGDLSFTTSSGSEESGTIHLKFLATGNYITDGVLRIYADAEHKSAPQTIVLDRFPRPLQLGDDSIAQLERVHATSNSSSAVFPTEIYETLQ